MKHCCIIICSASLIIGAQVRSVSVKPIDSLTLRHSLSDRTPQLDEADGKKRFQMAGAPVIGYALRSSPLEIQAIVEKATLPLVSETVTLPNNCRRLYLPPRQQYALVETDSDEPVAIWAMHRAFITEAFDEPVKIKGAAMHPDAVVFSARGDAFILYSQPTHSLQVVNQLSQRAYAHRELSAPNMTTPIRAAISDDGALVTAVLNDGSLVCSWDGGPWRLIPLGYTSVALLFVPKSYALAISDRTNKAIMILPITRDATQGARVLAQNIDADYLAATKDGELLIAANQSTGQIWTIGTNSGLITPTEPTGASVSIEVLRDGFSLLLSTPRGLALKTLGYGGDLREPTVTNGTDKLRWIGQRSQ